MKFLVDAQLPPVLAHWLREAGHDAQHAYEIGLAEAADSTIWSRAHAQGQVIITKDEDFARRARTGAPGPIIVWLRVGNTSNADLRDWLTPQLPELIRMLEQGYRVIEVR